MRYPLPKINGIPPDLGWPGKQALVEIVLHKIRYAPFFHLKQIMKYLILSLTLLCTLPLFAQKHDLEFDWPKRRVMGGLYHIFSLGENGTVFYEQVVKGPMSATMKISYVSADGKRSWVSDDVKNIAIDCDVVWDNTGFIIYNKNSKKKQVELWHFDYSGKLTASGEPKFDYPVLSVFRSGGKLVAILESDKKQLKKLYLQELAPKTFAPLGTPKQVEAPEGKVHSDLQIASRLKGTVENHWAFLGADETRLLFYGKKIMLKEGLVQFEVVVTDHGGRRTGGFTQQIALAPGRHVNRSRQSHRHLRRINWMDEYYTGGSAPGEQVYVRQYGVDPGVYGECMVDWSQAAVYFYGKSSSKPEDSRIEPDGYFIQKYSFTGEKQWAVEEKTPKTGKSKSAETLLNLYDDVFYLNPATGLVVYRDFPTLNQVLDANGTSSMKASVDLKTLNADYTEALVTTRFDNSRLFGFYHSELDQTPILSKLFPAEAAAALQKHLETNGHPASWYLIQANNKSFTVLETDPSSEAYSVWTVGF